MNNIKILDCTLRDGGYINNWDFGYKNICSILSNLISAKIDYIECGFLKPIVYNQDKSLYSSIENLKSVLPSQSCHTKYTLMINFGEYDIDKIPLCPDKNIALRIVFKKGEYLKAIQYCRACKEKGYDVFVNPMHTNTYSSEELLDLVKEVNKFLPKGLTIVDTTGAMKEKDILTAFYIIDSALNKNISLCFHSHNNLQLSFSNAQCLMKVCNNRELIIDSTIFGMGRGAGNLCTELITQYLNDNYNGDYDIIPILKIVDEYINPIFAKTPWGYSVPYYLSATNHCHPNYAKFLVDKQTMPVEIINTILEILPADKRSVYDENLIKQIYLDKFGAVTVDDFKTLQYIKNLIQDSNILILAPGKSILTERGKIHSFIKEKSPVIISLNFLPKDYEVDFALFTNLKRFSAVEFSDTPIIVSSNIPAQGDNIMSINYFSYLNNSKMFDNVALMALKLLINLNVKKVYCAGLDGFSNIPLDNYCADKLINTAQVSEIDNRNEIMKEMISLFKKEIDIDFVTESLYGGNQ